MSRTSARRHAFKLIFMFEFLHSDISNMFDIYVSDFLQEFNEYEKGIIYDELNGVCENLSEIDEIINENSKWAFNRLNKVDLALLRLAIYELCYEKNKTPVVINEIVNLANRYGSEKSPGFVNGILAKISSDLENSYVYSNSLDSDSDEDDYFFDEEYWYLKLKRLVDYLPAFFGNFDVKKYIFGYKKNFGR